jgi:hypothetical protein
MVQLACTHEGNAEEKNNGYVVFKGNIHGSASLYTLRKHRGEEQRLRRLERKYA